MNLTKIIRTYGLFAARQVEFLTARSIFATPLLEWYENREKI
jgi:hypothetical protein